MLIYMIMSKEHSRPGSWIVDALTTEKRTLEVLDKITDKNLEYYITRIEVRE